MSRILGRIRHGLSGFGAVGFFCVAVLPEGVRADAFSDYQLIARFSLPSDVTAIGTLSDGRMMTLSGADVLVETAPASHTFSTVGTLAGADFPSFGAAFLIVSPDGTRFAVGNNGGASFNNYRVGVFSVSTLEGTWFAAAHFDAAWINNDRIAITAGDFVDPSYISVLNANSPDPENPENPMVIDGIGGASAGVAIDARGNLFTGNGFTFGGPSGTGLVKAFLNADWTTALSGGPILDFENDGLSVVDLLSASPIGFDADGNLFLGGGDFAKGGQYDFVAVVRATAVADAVSGMGPVDHNDSALVRRLDPDPGNDSNFFYVAYNSPLKRLYVKDVGSTRVHVYWDTMGIPAASTWGLIVMAISTMTCASLVVRRRNVAVASMLVGPSTQQGFFGVHGAARAAGQPVGQARGSQGWTGEVARTEVRDSRCFRVDSDLRVSTR